VVMEAYPSLIYLDNYAVIATVVIDGDHLLSEQPRSDTNICYRFAKQCSDPYSRSATNRPEEAGILQVVAQPLGESVTEIELVSPYD
jgi:hypothetical protein